MSQYKTFVLPFVPDEAAEEELNAFLRSHRVIAVERVREAIGWCFCVEWLEGRPGESPSGRGLRYAEKVDYMKVLDPPTFAVFSKPRARRKEMAREAGLPAFSIFTDAQLAEIAKLEKQTLGGLAALDGVGEARVKSFGEKILSVIGEQADEAGGLLRLETQLDTL